MKKGFVNFLEMIIVVVVLLVAFSIFFPGFSYRSGWTDAQFQLKTRDLVLAIDRVGQLNNYSFNSTNLQSFLDDALSRESRFLTWAQTDGTIKNTLKIACNCSDYEINNLISWFEDLRINDRKIEVLPCYTNLEKINPCLASSDVLFISGYKNLAGDAYFRTLKTYMENGGGIVEMSDIRVQQIVTDLTHTKIFGIKAASSELFDEAAIYDEFRRKPDNATDIIYEPWKYFYHIPVPLQATNVIASPSSPPADPGLSTRVCSSLTTGNFSIQANITGENQGYAIPYQFWICDSEYVYFDTDLTKRADVEIQKGNYFNITDAYNPSGDWMFQLNYVNGQDSIGVSFKSEYKFHDFVKVEFGCVVTNHPGNPKTKDNPPPGWCEGKKSWVGYNALSPAKEDVHKILVQANTETLDEEPLPAVMLNKTSNMRAAWISNFTEEDIGDDERLLMISVLLWASNKRLDLSMNPQLNLGYRTSYLNTLNKDMFEVYKFSLGLGYPF